MRLTSSEYQVIVENAPNLIWRAGLDSLCNYFNKTWLDFTGRTYEQEYGNGWAEGVHPDDLERCVKTYLEHFEQRKAFEMEYRLLRHDGEWRWINDRGVPFFDEQGVFSGYIGSCVDVTDKVEGNIYKEISQKDSLTGILSRQYLMSQLQNCFQTARTNHTHLVVALMDIDKFKHINDNYGHLFGDSALKLFAGIVQDKIRKDDLFGRYGGDEFILIFSNTTVEIANTIIQRITESLERVALKTEHDDISLSFSVGLCDLTNETTIDELIAQADQCMYRQKKSKQLTDAAEDRG